MLPLIRRLLALRRPDVPGSGPPGEGAWARLLRQRRDRTRLAGLDDRLLRDIGLRRTVSAAGIDFAPLSSAEPHGAGRPAGPPHHCRRQDRSGRAAMSSHRRGAIDWP